MQTKEDSALVNRHYNRLLVTISTHNNRCQLYLPLIKYSCLYHPKQIDTWGAQIYSTQHPMFLCVYEMQKQQQCMEQIVTPLLNKEITV
jgi:hypothetical protein